MRTRELYRFGDIWEYKPNVNNSTLIAGVTLDVGTTPTTVLEEVRIERAPSGFYQLYYMYNEQKPFGKLDQWYIGNSYLNPIAAACDAAVRIFAYDCSDIGRRAFRANADAITKYNNENYNEPL
jgi:hypothetical protein